MKASLIITAHDEGAVIGATIRSVRRAVEFWQKKAADDFEIIVQVDKGTPETKECVKQFGQDVRILTSEFGDVGPARNAAAKEARGELVFFIDGDDLVSQGYVAKALEILDGADEEIVVCPEYCIGFSEDGTEGSVLKMVDSKSKAEDAFCLFNVNLWVMTIAGRRETFLKYPYIESVDGYGHEDYAMNIALTNAGIKHVAVPEEVYFYREKKRSRRVWNTERRATEPYSELFEMEFWRKSVGVKAAGDGDRKTLLGRLKKLYLATKKVAVLRKLAEVTRARLSKKLIKELPGAVMQEWEAIAELEPAISRAAKRRLNAMGVRGVNPYCPASAAYLELCRGGQGFAGIDFAKIARGLDEEQKDLLMSRIMVQSRGKATFVDGRDLEAWKRQHRELAGALGLAI